mgnify:CR=1 FL=1
MIEAMKQWAEGVSKAYDMTAWGHTERAAEVLKQIRDSIRTAIAEVEKQEPVLFIHPDTLQMANAHVGAWKPGHELPGYLPLYTTPPAAPVQEPVKLRRGDILRCIETDELCTVWATSTTHKTLVKWGGKDFSDYTAEQVGELFWLEPESSDVEIAAEQSDNYAAFHAGVRFARAHSFTTPKQEEVEIDWPDYHEQGMGCGLEDRGITDRYEAMRYGWDEALRKAMESVNLLGTVLYTTPPAAQRQWVRLTPREIYNLWEDSGVPFVDWDSFASITRAIEAKLKEKNT